MCQSIGLCRNSRLVHNFHDTRGISRGGGMDEDSENNVAKKLSSDSWVMRDLWDTEAAIRKNTHTTGLVTEPKKLSSVGVKRLIERALWAQGLRKDLKEGKKRHEFATCHSFRKYFKTRCELAGVKPINIENLMGHSTGISDAYYRPSENDAT